MANSDAGTRNAGLLTAVLRDGTASLVARPGPPPSPGPGQVLVAMRLAPINPADLLAIDGRYAVPLPPCSPLGAEGVGDVVALGDGVTGLAVGDRVLPLSRGNWTTHRLLEAGDLVRVGADLPLEQAAMLRINPATAWRLLRTVRLEPGGWVVQNAAGSSVAGLVRRFAAARGIGVVNVVRDAGAHPALPCRLEDGPDLPERVSAVTGGAPVRLALDCVAGEATGRLAGCLAPGGRVTVFGHLSGHPCTIPSTLLTARGLAVGGFSLRPAEAGEGPARLRTLYAGLAEALARPPAIAQVAAIHPLADLDRALAAARRGGGRILLALDRQ